MNRRTLLLSLTLIALLGAAAAAAAIHLAGRRAAASQAAGDLVECRHLADQIRRLSARPRRASDHERLSSETSTLIEKAAAAAGVTGGRLVSIHPEPAQRVAESVYKEKPTRIVLRGVTVRQTVELMQRLAARENPLSVKSVNLTAATPQEDRDAWHADIVVTYLIYDPPHTEKSRGVLP